MGCPRGWLPKPGSGGRPARVRPGVPRVGPAGVESPIRHERRGSAGGARIAPVAGESRRRARSPAVLHRGLAGRVAGRRDRLLPQGQPPAGDPARAGREGHRPPGRLRGRVLPGALGRGRRRALDRGAGPGEAAGAARPRGRRRRARDRRHAGRAAPARGRRHHARGRARVPARASATGRATSASPWPSSRWRRATRRRSGCGSRRSPFTSCRPASTGRWPRSRAWRARWSSSGRSHPSASRRRPRCWPAWPCAWACPSSTSAAASRLPRRSRPTRAP